MRRKLHNYVDRGTKLCVCIYKIFVTKAFVKLTSVKDRMKFADKQLLSFARLDISLSKHSFNLFRFIPNTRFPRSITGSLRRMCKKFISPCSVSNNVNYLPERNHEWKKEKRKEKKKQNTEWKKKNTVSIIDSRIFWIAVTRFKKCKFAKCTRMGFCRSACSWKQSDRCANDWRAFMYISFRESYEWRTLIQRTFWSNAWNYHAISGYMSVNEKCSYNLCLDSFRQELYFSKIISECRESKSF